MSKKFQLCPADEHLRKSVWTQHADCVRPPLFLENVRALDAARSVASCSIYSPPAMKATSPNSIQTNA